MCEEMNKRHYCPLDGIYIAFEPWARIKTPPAVYTDHEP